MLGRRTSFKISSIPNFWKQTLKHLLANSRVCFYNKLRPSAFRSSIITVAKQPLTQGGDEVLVRRDRFVAAMVFNIPDAQGLVVGRGQQELAARMEKGRPDPVVVSYQREEALGGGHVPDFQGFVARAGHEEGPETFSFLVLQENAASRCSFVTK